MRYTKGLGKIAALHYSDGKSNGFIKLKLKLFGPVIDLAVQEFNKSISQLDEISRRKYSKLVWQYPETNEWSMRAFDNPEQRSKNYPIDQLIHLSIKSKYGLKLIELGCTNGGNVHLFEHRKGIIKKFSGSDISRSMTQLQ